LTRLASTGTTASPTADDLTEKLAANPAVPLDIDPRVIMAMVRRLPRCARFAQPALIDLPLGQEDPHVVHLRFSSAADFAISRSQRRCGSHRGVAWG
jgi:hypothetical protein